jgi:ComF family protein
MKSPAHSRSNFSGGLKRLWEALLQAVFPRVCVGCRQDVPAGHGSSLCPACWDNMPRWTGLICQVCGVPLPDGGEKCFVCRREPRAFWRCRSASINEGVLRDCIHAFKYKAQTALGKDLGELLYDGYLEFPGADSIDAIAAVPLHFFRHRWRTFNQAQILAEQLSQKTNLPLLHNVMKRRRYTRPQTGLSRKNRKWNMMRVFKVAKPDLIWKKHVLLVDDVCTTGATLEACARALRAAGAKRVSALTVARQTLFKMPGLLNSHSSTSSIR